jgi:hypothetical protein
LKKNWFLFVYWIFSAGLISVLLVGLYANLGIGLRAACLLSFFLLFVGKVSLLLFLLIDDLRRLIIKLGRLGNIQVPTKTQGIKISGYPTL